MKSSGHFTIQHLRELCWIVWVDFWFYRKRNKFVIVECVEIYLSEANQVVSIIVLTSKATFV